MSWLLLERVEADLCYVYRFLEELYFLRRIYARRNEEVNVFYDYNIFLIKRKNEDLLEARKWQV